MINQTKLLKLKIINNRSLNKMLIFIFIAFLQLNNYLGTNIDSYLDIEDLNSINVTDEIIKSDPLFNEYIENHNKAEKASKEVACLFLTKEFLHKNKVEISNVVKLSENKEDKAFDRIFLDIHNNCILNIKNEEAEYVFGYKNNSNLFANEKLKSLVKFNKY